MFYTSKAKFSMKIYILYLSFSIPCFGLQRYLANLTFTKLTGWCVILLTNGDSQQGTATQYRMKLSSTITLIPHFNGRFIVSALFTFYTLFHLYKPSYCCLSCSVGSQQLAYWISLPVTEKQSPLKSLAIAVLQIVPHAAGFESLFSEMGATKTKIRSQMKTNTLKMSAQI